MKQNKVIQELEGEQFKQSIPEFRVGDTICIHQRIIEGDKERVQLFTGTVIARRGGGLSETIALYRFSYGAGIERVFLLHSPKIAKIDVIRTGKVRKSKLYYLRGTSGKASKIEEHIAGERGSKKSVVESAPAT
ncbi:MAG: 50S ribosomal protein L19 [Candidatus Melainabacteria bacterium]|nr:50S ribosomal protein L19 [Candidatus Melainabacteria bacterium]